MSRFALASSFLFPLGKPRKANATHINSMNLLPIPSVHACQRLNTSPQTPDFLGSIFYLALRALARLIILLFGINSKAHSYRRAFLPYFHIFQIKELKLKLLGILFSTCGTSWPPAKTHSTRHSSAAACGRSSHSALQQQLSCRRRQM